MLYLVSPRNTHCEEQQNSMQKMMDLVIVLRNVAQTQSESTSLVRENTDYIQVIMSVPVPTI